MDALDAVSGIQLAKESAKQLEKILNFNTGGLSSKHQHVAVGPSASGARLAPLGAVLASLNKCSLGKLLEAAKPFAALCEGLGTGLMVSYRHNSQSRQALAEVMQAQGKLCWVAAAYHAMQAMRTP
jgi:hypothetical protein